MEKLAKDIPARVILPYRDIECELPTLLDGKYGYASGRDKRRQRREQERKNKKAK